MLYRYLYLIPLFFFFLLSCNRDCDEAGDLEINASSHIKCLSGTPVSGVSVIAHGQDGSVLYDMTDMNGRFFFNLDPSIGYNLEFRYDFDPPFLIDSFDFKGIRSLITGRVRQGQFSRIQLALMDMNTTSNAITTLDLALAQKMVMGEDIGVSRWVFFSEDANSFYVDDIPIIPGGTIPNITLGHRGDIFGIQCPCPEGLAKGRVRCNNGMPFKGAKVLANGSDGSVQETVTDDLGLYFFNYSSGNSYDISYEYDQTLPISLTLNDIEAILNFVNNRRAAEDYTYFNNVLLDVNNSSDVSPLDYSLMKKFIEGNAQLMVPRWRFFSEPFQPNNAIIDKFTATSQNLPKVTAAHSGDIDGIECP